MSKAVVGGFEIDVDGLDKYRGLSIEDKQRLLQALIEDVKTPREMAGTLGLDYNKMRVAYKYLKLNGHDILRKRNISASYSVWKDDIQALSDKGHRAGKIAEKLGLTEEKVRRIMKRYDIIPVRIPKHGTPNEYQHWGCRCTPCKKANTRRHTEARSNRKQRVEDAPHGTESGYWNWDCRCEPCKKVGSEVNKARTYTPPETRRRSLERQRWQDKEVMVLTDYSLTARDHALTLERSISSVNTRRAMVGIGRS